MRTDRDVRVRRVYDQPTTDDGIRVLVDRLWPCGLSREKAQLDDWSRQVAPPTALRRWYSLDPERFEEFGRRYRATLRLLTATRNAEISEAAVLAAMLRG